MVDNNAKKLKELLDQDLVDINNVEGVYNYSVLHYAVTHQKIEIIKLLLSYNADVNA